MIKIPLSSRKYPGLVALVDDEDAELVSGYSWYPENGDHTFYAVAHVPGVPGNITKMHRLITGTAPGQKVDHTNRNGLDNRRENLRFGTDSQHQANRGIRRDNTSGYKGVHWDKERGKWKVEMQVEGRRRVLGRSDDLIEAAKAYDAAAREHHGEFAVLNFPEITEIEEAA